MKIISLILLIISQDRKTRHSVTVASILRVYVIPHLVESPLECVAISALHHLDPARQIPILGSEFKLKFQSFVLAPELARDDKSDDGEQKESPNGTKHDEPETRCSSLVLGLSFIILRFVFCRLDLHYR